MLFSPIDKGQGIIEYALILVLIALVVIVVLQFLGTSLGAVFSGVNSQLSDIVT